MNKPYRSMSQSSGGNFQARRRAQRAYGSVRWAVSSLRPLVLRACAEVEAALAGLSAIVIETSETSSWFSVAGNAPHMWRHSSGWRSAPSIRIRTFRFRCRGAGSSLATAFQGACCSPSRGAARERGGRRGLMRNDLRRPRALHGDRRRISSGSRPTIRRRTCARRAVAETRACTPAS